MTDKVRKLVLSGSILALAAVLVFFQLPLLGMGLDFSYIAILIGRRYIGYWYSILLMLIYPWFSIGFMGPIGVLFMILQGFGILTLDILLNRKGYSWVGVILVVLLGTLWSVIVNFLVIVPMYWYLAGETAGNMLGNYSEASSFIKFEIVWMITSLVFNPIKLSIVYGVAWGVWIGLENSVNQEPNDEWKRKQEQKIKLDQQNNEAK